MCFCHPNHVHHFNAFATSPPFDLPRLSFALCSSYILIRETRHDACSTDFIHSFAITVAAATAAAPTTRLCSNINYV